MCSQILAGLLLGFLLLASASCDALKAASLESKVKAALKADSRTAQEEFEVAQTGEGVVTITGEVPTGEEMDAVAEIAGKVEGVKQVVNHCHMPEESNGMMQDTVVPSPFL